MSTFEEAIVQRLAADVSVAAVVGTRITVGGLETDIDRPYITVRRLATNYSNTVDGRDANTNALLEIISHGLSLAVAHPLASDVRDSLEQFDGTIAVSGGSNVRISGILITDMQQFEPRIGSKTYRVAQFYSVWGED